jgi:phosphoglycerate dehydrogenase-like enzyme
MNDKMKILFACKIADEQAKARMEETFDLIEVEAADEATLLQYADKVEGIIIPFTKNVIVTEKVIDAGKNLKFIGTTYGGTRQGIADAYAVEKGLTVIHTGATRPRPMAEYTLGLALSSLMQMHTYHHYMKGEDPWPRFRLGRTRILQDRKVGIIGFGRIGKGIFDIFRLFTSDISVQSGHMSPREAKELGVELKSVDQVFESCEIIILAGGYTEKTYHMIQYEHFMKMQKDAHFINIARGKMVDEKGMVKALEERDDFYLALDVFEEEPLPEDSPLRKSDKVLMTPHRANNSMEFEERWQCLADELELFAGGNRPESALNAERIQFMSES